MMKKIFLIALMLLWTTQAYAGFYVWTDERGNRHYTDSEKNIPETYKDQAKAPSLQDPIVKSDYEAASAEAMETTEGTETAKLFDGKPVLYWVQQINRMETDLIEAENTVTLLEHELESLEHLKIGQVRRNPIVGKFYTRPVSKESSLYYVDENEKKLLQMKLDQVRQQVKTIEQELGIFRDDAKKAGVPPKYL